MNSHRDSPADSVASSDTRRTPVEATPPTLPEPVALAAAKSPPSAAAFPAWPSGWYYLCSAHQVRRQPLGIEIAGRGLVVFRDQAGQPVALDADCSHMGADLGRGRVARGCLACPFHGWQYNSLGECVHIPAQQEIPPQARQSSYQVREQHGLLFGFLWGKPLYELPALFEPAVPLVCSSPYQYTMECPWYMFGGNGFDLQHFELVHDRELEQPPVIDCPAHHARRIRFLWRVVGSSPLNRLLRIAIGSRVEVTITSWAGTMISVTAKFRRAISRVLFLISPEGPDRTRANLFVLTNRRPIWQRPLQPLNLRLRRAMTLAFLRGDMQDVRRGVYRPAMLVEADRTLIDYYHWLAAHSHSERD